MMTTTSRPITSVAAVTPMLIQATMRAAVTKPRPAIRPSLAWISLPAIEAKTSATIAAITGHTAQLMIARIKATIALLEVGTAVTTDGPATDGVAEAEAEAEAEEVDPVTAGHVCGVASASTGVADAGEGGSGVPGITGSVMDSTVVGAAPRDVGHYGVDQVTEEFAGRFAHDGQG